MTTLPDLNSLPLPSLFLELSRDGAPRRLLELARDEDLGPLGSPAGDITGVAWGGGNQPTRARLVVRTQGVIAGLAAAPILLDLFAPSCRLNPLMRDGQTAAPGATLALLDGPLGEILALERTLLNLIGRLSGVATLTARHVRAIELEAPGSRARLCDTRKTTPGLRALEKYAVRCGGGTLHRLGLHDAVLIKDNHIAATPTLTPTLTPALTPTRLAERVAEASTRARALRPLRFVEVEVDSLEQLGPLLELPAGVVDIILLDNMTPPMLRDGVALRDELKAATLLEASGGVTLETIGAVARAGVDRISVGALTHSAPALDVALDFG